MFTIIDSGIRGGISMISNRYAQANNPLVAGYDATQPKSWIKGLDANNLYGWAMSLALPISDFEWVPQDELSKISWLSLGEEDAKGYIATVDLEYPTELHDAHNDYPLAPERMRVKDEWLSDKLINIRSHYNIPRGWNIEAYTQLNGQKGICHPLSKPSVLFRAWDEVDEGP